MGSKANEAAAEAESTTPGREVLLLLSVAVAPKIELPDPAPSGMRTPPFHTTAAVPFRWEEEPGKPRPCTALAIVPNTANTTKCLELPPRLLNEAIIAKMPSPIGTTNNTIIQAPSFRMMGGECYGSFRSYGADRDRAVDDDGGEDASPSIVMVSKRRVRGEKETRNGSGSRWWGFRSWKSKWNYVKGNGEIGGIRSYVFPSSSRSSSSSSCSVERESSEWSSEGKVWRRKKSTGMRRAGSFPALPHHSHSHFNLMTLYEGLKGVMIPWSNNEVKKKEKKMMAP